MHGYYVHKAFEPALEQAGDRDGAATLFRDVLQRYPQSLREDLEFGYLVAEHESRSANEQFWRARTLRSVPPQTRSSMA